jgi:hypothetical protein
MSPFHFISETTRRRPPWFTMTIRILHELYGPTRRGRPLDEVLLATYAHCCASGACSNRTMEVETFKGRSKILIVEVEIAAKLICQARGKGNLHPFPLLSR